MKEYKDKAHNLYAIQRKEEAITNSVSKVLPLLMDDKKILFVAGINGDVKELCKVCVNLLLFVSILYCILSFLSMILI